VITVRNFATVTKKVGNLAKRSSYAAKDTTALIDEYVQKTDTEHIHQGRKRASVLVKELQQSSQKAYHR
jgi:methyl-accepting chemotaxis protein